MCFSSASEVTTATRWLDPVSDATHEAEMRRSVSDNGPTGSDGVPSDTTEDDWSRGSPEDPDEVPSPSSSPSPSPAEPPEHTGPITELDRKVSYRSVFIFDSGISMAYNLEPQTPCRWKLPAFQDLLSYQVADDLDDHRGRAKARIRLDVRRSIKSISLRRARVC